MEPAARSVAVNCLTTTPNVPSTELRKFPQKLRNLKNYSTFCPTKVTKICTNGFRNVPFDHLVLTTARLLNCSPKRVNYYLMLFCKLITCCTK